MDTTTILVVDDEERMGKLVRDYLQREGYQVLEAGDGEEALEQFFKNHGIGLVLLDVMMPRLDGWQVLAEIRRYSTVPVIMLTARAEERDELKGYSLGVDEYVTKPFSPRVLMARISAVLRRHVKAEDSILEMAGLRLDKTAHVLTVDGKTVELSFKEFELMTYFMENPGIALSRESILNHVWNYNYYGDARTIDTHVKKLRSKIGEKGDLIRTIWGLGYKFEVENEGK